VYIAPEEVKFKKIITDVDTRRNSTLFLIRSIFEMKSALQSLKEGRFKDTDKTDKKMKQMIPSAQTFDIIDDVAPDEDEFFDAALKFTQNMEATRPTQEGRREGGLTPLKIEIEKYLDLPRLTNPKVNVLGWWKAQKCTFLLLAECAKKYHCIPASSAPSERVFSRSGNLITQNRKSLSHKKLFTCCSTSRRT